MDLEDHAEPEELFFAYLPHIERLIAHSCRSFSREDMEDFSQTVKLKLFKDDYAVLRKFRGRCKPTYYLAQVVKSALKDYRDHLWGKWRPPQEVLRLGEPAVSLFRWLDRDKVKVEQACDYLLRHGGHAHSRRELEELAARLPVRVSRRIEGEEKLVELPTPDPTPEQAMLRRETDEQRSRVVAILHDGLETLEDEDRLIARMAGDHTIAEIARILGLEQKPLYRRLDKILRALRETMERAGVKRQDVQHFLKGDA